MVNAAERLGTGLAGLDAQLGGGVPQGSVHILLSEPMNAQELFTYHMAGAGGAHYVSTELSEDEVNEGVTRVGGAETKVQILPNGKDWQFKLPKAERVIIDSFSHLSRSIGWEKTMILLEEIKHDARKNGTVFLLTVSLGLHSDEEVTLLKLWADGVMELGFDRQGFGLYPYLKVTKMRGVPDSARFLLFKETERGLFMESTRRVF